MSFIGCCRPDKLGAKGDIAGCPGLGAWPCGQGQQGTEQHSKVTLWAAGLGCSTDHRLF